MNTDVLEDSKQSLTEAEGSDSDFIKEYMEYADIFEAPPEAHEAVAMTTISAVANGKVWIQNGGQKITLDDWCLLLSGSGVGRNTLVSLLWPVLEGGELKELPRNTIWGSKQGFYQDLAENPTAFFVWEELSSTLKALSDSRFGEAKQWLTNCYDNERKPADTQYRRTGSTQDTPGIVFSAPPRLSILATSSYEWFTSSLSAEDSMGGFIPRWRLIELPDSDRAIPTPKRPLKGAIPDLADCLREVGKLKGAVDLSNVEDDYADWYVSTRKRFREQPNGAMAEAFWNRHRVHLLKLAAIYAMATSGDLVVTPRAMERAIETARKTEKTIFKLLPTGMSAEGAAVDKLQLAVHKAGPGGLLRSEFTRAFQHIRTSERDSRLRTLQQAKAITSFGRPTDGRKAEVLVHKDHLSAHAQQFPEDESWG
jgi:hypothetical protein